MSNEKMYKQMKKISNDVNIKKIDMTEQGKWEEEAKPGLTLEKISREKLKKPPMSKNASL